MNRQQDLSAQRRLNDSQLHHEFEPVIANTNSNSSRLVAQVDRSCYGGGTPQTIDEKVNPEFRIQNSAVLDKTFTCEEPSLPPYWESREEINQNGT